jgi:hypothetical protein
MMLFIVVMGIQARLLLRIRNILQVMSMNSETVVQYVRKIASITGKDAVPNKASTQTATQTATQMNTCQFCKHRLAFINTTKGPNVQDDFYHKCEVRDCSVSLSDTCPLFEEDKEVF